MSDWTFANPHWVHLFWPAALVFVFLAQREWRRDQTLGRFVSATMQKRLASDLGLGLRLWRLGLRAAFVALCILAMMRPQAFDDSGTGEEERVVADIVIALDVSKSMLAEDALPNRLVRAKSEIGRMLKELQGHRVSLVVFAGQAAILSPLTPDYAYFRMILRGASTTSVSRGGTAIGDAIRTGIRAFDEDGGAASRILVLITDGEDHDTYPEEAAQEAGEQGIKIVAIGLGSEEGSEILITDPKTGVQEAVKDKQGNTVMSRIDAELLKTLAQATDGVFVPAGVNALDLKKIVDVHIEPMVEEVTVKAKQRTPDERYQLLLFFALSCLLASSLLGLASKGGAGG